LAGGRGPKGPLFHVANARDLAAIVHHERTDQLLLGITDARGLAALVDHKGTDPLFRVVDG